MGFKSQGKEETQEQDRLLSRVVMIVIIPGGCYFLCILLRLLKLSLLFLLLLFWLQYGKRNLIYLSPKKLYLYR